MRHRYSVCSAMPIWRQAATTFTSRSFVMIFSGGKRRRPYHSPTLRPQRALFGIGQVFSRQTKRTHLKLIFHRIELGQDHRCLIIDKRSIADWLTVQDPQLNAPLEETTSHPTLKRRTRGARKSIASPSHDVDPADHHVLDLAIVIKRRGLESRIVIAGMSVIRKPDRALADMTQSACLPSSLHE